MNRTKYYFHLFVALFSILIGPKILHTYFTNPSAGLPLYEKLTLVEGKVDWIKREKYGVKFGFQDNKINFNYPSKAKGMWKVEESLNNSFGANVKILAELDDSFSPMGSNEKYHDVFEVIVGEQVVRSYEDSSQGWLGDNKLMPYIGFGLLFGGVYIAVQAHRKRKYA
jgi:hypothetical protein